MLPRLAAALCLVLAGCAFTTKEPLRVVRDTNDRALSWAIGGVYDTLNGHLTITADGAVVANGSFGALDSELQLAGAYQGYAIAALCKRERDNSAHVGSTSVTCEVSVADSSIGFDSDQNEVLVIARDGSTIKIDRAPKYIVANRILDLVVNAQARIAQEPRLP